MKTTAFATMTICLALLSGCQGGGSSSAPQATPKPAEADSKVKAALAKLPDSDRKVAEEQKTCPITGEALGSMGVPIKLTLKGQTVFLCCSGCQDKAEADPDKTLKAAADAKTNSGGK